MKNWASCIQELDAILGELVTVVEGIVLEYFHIFCKR